MVIVIVVAALVLLVLVAGLWIESRAGGIIEREFARMTHEQYHLKTGNVDVSLLNRSVTLADITVTPNLEAPTDSVPHPLRIVDFSARELLVAGIRFNKRDGATNLKIRKLLLKSPKIRVEQMQRDGKTLHTDTAKVTPLRIAIGRIVVSEGYVEHSRGRGIDTMRNVVEGFELRTEKLFVDTGSGFAPSALGDNMRMIIRKITHMPEDESTRMEIDSVAVETAAKTLSVASFAIVPTYTKAEFGYKAWRHKDWERMSFTEITCRGVDFERLISSGELHVDSVNVAGGGVSSYKNRNIRRVEWVKPMHYQLIQRLPLKFSVGTVAIGSVNAQYEELKAGGDKAGIITFDGIGGRIDGLTNIPTPERAYSEWRLHARVMNTAPLTITGYMPIDSLNDRFELSVLLGNTEAAAFNDMIIPLGNLAVSDGTIRKIDFHIVGNARRATIDMTFLYDGLKAVLLKEKDGQVKERAFLSGIVNSMVLIDSNPRHGEIRTAHRTADRDPLRSPFNYLWQTVFAGVKESIGLGKL